MKRSPIFAFAAFGLLSAFAPLAATTEPRPTHPWRLVDGRYWQIATDDDADASVSDEADPSGSCPAGMVHVQGRMKRDGAMSVEDLQKTACTSWIKRELDRCAAYDAEQWSRIASKLPTQPMRFCIDRYEYPNRRGGYPLILVDWYEAAMLCTRANKRLCTEDEWTFACEGEDALPYPYGYERDADACVIDRQWRSIDSITLTPRASPKTAMELDRLWQGEASGSRPRCVSPFGVHDLTGNVDEWTVSTRATGYRSILKGGYWGPVRTRCRPSTRAHDETFVFYQQSLRCCADARTTE